MNDLAAFGAPQEVLDQARAATRGAEFEIWPENVETVNFFMRLQTQWVYAGMGGLVGLNYQSVDMLFRIERTSPKKQREILEGLRFMEAVVVNVIAEKAKAT